MCRCVLQKKLSFARFGDIQMVLIDLREAHHWQRLKISRLFNSQYHWHFLSAWFRLLCKIFPSTWLQSKDQLESPHAKTQKHVFHAISVFVHMATFPHTPTHIYLVKMRHLLSIMVQDEVFSISQCWTLTFRGLLGSGDGIAGQNQVLGWANQNLNMSKSNWIPQNAYAHC